MNQFLKIIFPLYILVWNACSKNENLIPRLDLPNRIETVFEIKEWLLIGPFTFDTLVQKPSETFINEENISLGFDENGINSKIFKKLQTGKFKPFYANRKNAFLNLFDYVNGQRTDKSNFYAYTSVFCHRERELFLVSDGCSAYSIWINGIKVQETTAKPDAYKVADKFAVVKLKKGKNLIFAKINRGNNLEFWKLIVGFTNLKYAQKLYLTNYACDFILNPLVHLKLSIYTGPFTNGKITILNDSTQIKYTFKSEDIPGSVLNIKLPASLPDGIYKCRLQLNKRTLEQAFYFGDFKSFCRKILTQTNLCLTDSNIIRDWQVSKEMLSYILDSGAPGSGIVDTVLYSQNCFEWGKNLFELFKFASQNKNLVNNSATSFKTFKNSQNAENHAFIFHVDNKILENKKKFPLILVPISDTVNAKIIQSPFLTNLSQIKMDGKLADEKGFAICWLFLYGRDYTLRKSVKELSGVLTRLVHDYPMLDTTRLFLYGESVGGQRAMLLAQMQPYRYSGLAVFNPFILEDENVENPMNFYVNLMNIHTLILHGQKFEGSPFDNFRKFVFKSNKLGLHKLSYKETANGQLEFSQDYKKVVFNYFERILQVLPLNLPNDIRFKTYDKSFNTAYWINFTALNDSIMCELLSRYNPYKHRIILKCVNIKDLKINTSKLGIPKWKKLQYVVNAKSQKVVYDKSGNIVILIKDTVNK